jgi:hypothetical protein
MEMKEENFVMPAERNPAEDHLAQGLRIFDEIFPEYRGVLVRHLLLHQRGGSTWRSEFCKKSLQRKIAELELFEGSQSLYKHLAVVFCHGTTRLIWSGQIIRP